MIDHPHQWFGGRTYAQHGDDLAILNLFKRIGLDQPSYLDIGAHHPFTLSNTALLYARGARGINVEANPDLMPAFRQLRPDDVNLNVGVGPHADALAFYRCSEPGRSSFVRELAAPHGIVDEIAVEVVTVGSIVERHAGGRFPDLLSIDVEGLDLPVLRGLHLTAGNAPKVICAEAVTAEADIGAELAALMTARGFFLHSWAGSNMIFVRADYRAAVY